MKLWMRQDTHINACGEEPDGIQVKASLRTKEEGRQKGATFKLSLYICRKFQTELVPLV